MPISCNAAFIGEALKLPSAAIGTEAARFGFGTRSSLPVPAVTGSVPSPASRVEQAADAIGQGRVTASPLQMAPRPLDPRVVVSLRQLLRAVVTKGTGTALAGLPGRPVFGKTGTAEFGTATPPATHAWFIGYRGTLGSP